MTTAAIGRRARTSFDLIVVGLFLAAIVSPAVDMLVRDEAERGPAAEMRTAAPMPRAPVNLETLSKYPAAFEAHFSDTFGLRDQLMRLNCRVLYYVFARSPTKDILVGKDGWLFWAGDWSGEVFRGTAPLKAEELAGWQFMLEDRARALAKAGCDYVWIIAPNKETIYPERMPSEWTQIGPSRLDQFAAWMKAHTKVDVLDLRPAMLAAKQHDSSAFDVLCTPFGTHWTGRGSMVAARAIVDDLRKRHPEAAPFDEKDFELLPEKPAVDSLAGQLYMVDVLRSPDRVPTPRDGRSFTLVELHEEGPRHMVTRANAHDVLPATVMFHDSFGPFVSSLLAANCATLDTWSERFDAHVVDPDKTRIVIDIFVERALVTQLPGLVAPADVVGANARFEALPRVAFDLASTPSAGKAVADMSIERVEVDGHPAVRVTQHGARDGLELGPIALPASGDVLLRVEADSPQAQLLDVTWRAGSNPKYLRRDRTSIALDAGSTRGILVLPALGADAFLLVRPRENGVPVTLRAFVVRAAQ